MSGMFGQLPEVVIPTPHSTWWALVPAPVAGPVILHPTAAIPAQTGLPLHQRPEDFNTPAHPLTADVSLTQTPIGYSFAPAQTQRPTDAPYQSWWHPPTYESVMASMNRRPVANVAAAIPLAPPTMLSPTAALPTQAF